MHKRPRRPARRQVGIRALVSRLHRAAPATSPPRELRSPECACTAGRAPTIIVIPWPRDDACRYRALNGWPDFGGYAVGACDPPLGYPGRPACQLGRGCTAGMRVCDPCGCDPCGCEAYGCDPYGYGCDLRAQRAAALQAAAVALKLDGCR